MYTSTEGRHKGGPGFLGARYAPMFLDKGLAPREYPAARDNNDLDHQERLDLRGLLSTRFARARENSGIGSHNSAYSRVRGLMASEKLFDLSQEPEAMRVNMARPSLASRRSLPAA